MRVFISYRRQGDQGTVGRLADRLGALHGDDNVFRDADTLRAGQNFSDVILKSLEAAQVVIAIIDHRWIGRRWIWWSRIRDPADWVRRELEHALHKGIPILPVLVNGAPLPGRRGLPSSLHGLLSVQAARLRSDSWAADMKEVLKAIDDSTQRTPSALTWPTLDAEELRSRQRRDRATTALITAGLSTAVVAMTSVLWIRNSPPAQALPPAEVDLKKPESWTLPPESVARSKVAHGALRAALVELQSSTREANGNIDGFNVAKFTARFASSGMSGNLPWSSAFVTWCYLDAVQRRANDGRAKLPFADSPSVAEVFRSMSDKRWTLQPFDASAARPGDIVFFKLQNRIGHAELVYAVKDGQVCSIGGNVKNRVTGQCRQFGTDGSAVYALGFVPADLIDVSSGR
jgi:hypothetical protein